MEGSALRPSAQRADRARCAPGAAVGGVQGAGSARHTPRVPRQAGLLRRATEESTLGHRYPGAVAGGVELPHQRLVVALERCSHRGPGVASISRDRSETRRTRTRLLVRCHLTCRTLLRGLDPRDPGVNLRVDPVTPAVAVAAELLLQCVEADLTGRPPGSDQPLSELDRTVDHFLVRYTWPPPQLDDFPARPIRVDRMRRIRLAHRTSPLLVSDRSASVEVDRSIRNGCTDGRRLDWNLGRGPTSRCAFGREGLGRGCRGRGRGLGRSCRAVDIDRSALVDPIRHFGMSSGLRRSGQPHTCPRPDRRTSS